MMSDPRSSSRRAVTPTSSRRTLKRRSVQSERRGSNNGWMGMSPAEIERIMMMQDGIELRQDQLRQDQLRQELRQDQLIRQDQILRRSSQNPVSTPVQHLDSDQFDRSSESGRVLSAQTEEWQTQFFKTKLCPYHVEGRCINGQKCRFAHNPVEIRPLPDLHRTKLCESYVRKEPCTDETCPFAHDPSELRTSSHSFYKVTLCNFYKKGRCWNGAHCRFAHGVTELQVAPSSESCVKQQSPMQQQKSCDVDQHSKLSNAARKKTAISKQWVDESGRSGFSNELSLPSSTSETDCDDSGFDHPPVLSNDVNGCRFPTTERSARPVQQRRRSLGAETPVKDGNENQRRTSAIYDMLLQNRLDDQELSDKALSDRRLLDSEMSVKNSDKNQSVKFRTVNDTNQDQMLNDTATMLRMASLAQQGLHQPFELQNLQGFPRMDDVHSLTSALFSLIQQSSGGASPASTPWSTPARAPLLTVPNQSTDSMTSPGDISSDEMSGKIADQWAFELLKSLETTGDPNGLRPLQNDLSENLSQKGLSDATFRLSSFGGVNDHFNLSSHQFVSAAAVPPTSPQNEESSLGGLFQSEQQGGVGWPSTLENHSSKSESMSALPSLSNLVMSSIFDRTPSDAEKTIPDAAREKDEQKVQSSPMFSLNFDKLVGFVNDGSHSDEDGVSLTTASTGATTTAAHTPRQPAGEVGSPMRMDEENSTKDRAENQLVSQQLIQALREMAPTSRPQWSFPSPFGPFSSNLEPNNASKISGLFTPSSSGVTSPGVSSQVRCENSLSFPTEIDSKHMINGHGKSCGVNRQAAVLSPFSECFSDGMALGDLTPDGLNSPDSQWTPVPLAVARHASIPRITKLGDNHDLSRHQPEAFSG